jgi:hypothetical protein
MFFESYFFFSWKIDKLNPKLAKTKKSMSFRHIKNLGRKVTQFEYSKMCENE